MKKTEITTPKAIKRRIRISEAIRVGELAKQDGRAGQRCHQQAPRAWA
jgi:translation initiation factor IF-2